MHAPTLLVALMLGSCAGSQSVPASSSCQADRICLRTRGTAPLEAGRLVVVWERFGERAPPEVSFDIPFRGDEQTIAIPHAKIARPRTPSQIPPCNTERTECRRLVGVAVGYVLVLRDANGNGRIDADEVGKRSLLGAARVVVGFAEEAIEPNDTALSGMPIGFASYEPVRVRMFDKWKLAAPATVFELVVCTRGIECDPPVPNLT